MIARTLSQARLALLTIVLSIGCIEAAHAQFPLPAPLAASGTDHVCGVTTAGAAMCWGDNGNGQLGNGTTTSSNVPVQVSGLGAGTTIGIAAGQSHSCALTVGGGVRCWGSNFYGQLGRGTSGASMTPVDVAGLTSGVVAIAVHWSQSCALTSGGGVKCWGDNSFGALGDGTTMSRFSPVDVSGLTSGISAIDVGGFFACAVTSGGSVRCWGYNADGQLGDGTTTNRSSPVSVSGLASGVTSLSVGEDHACAVVSGAVRCWGGNAYAQVGDGSFSDRPTPTAVPSLSSGIQRVVAGAYMGCALATGGSMRCWGKGDYGQLGDGTTVTDRTQPVQVLGLTSGVVTMAAAGDTTCAGSSDGSLRCWGYGLGKIGNGSSAHTSAPTIVTGFGATSPPPPPPVALIPAPKVAAGQYHTCAMNASGSVYCWGGNANGQLGIGSSDASRSTPVAVAGSAARLSAGALHNCMVTTAGGVRCWGDNSAGQLGTGAAGNASSPVDASGLGTGINSVAAGGLHTCVLTSGNAVRCFGRNAEGQLGNGTTTNSNVAVNVTGISGVTAIGTGFTHSCAIAGGGALYCWGDNRYGQLGDGTTTNRSAPVAVTSVGGGVQSVHVGGYHTCAVLGTNEVRCWGQNTYGQLGDGTTVNRATPVASASVLVGTALSSGGYHSCARTTAGAAICWGNNSSGQVGDGTQVVRPLPALVERLASGVGAVATGIYHSCALMSDGGVRCWGENQQGQRGNGNFAFHATPEPVRGPGGSGFLDLTPSDGITVPPTYTASVAVVTTGSIGASQATVSAVITPQAADAGTTQSIFVYALAPASVVRAAAAKSGEEELPIFAKVAGTAKDVPVSCVLAQLNASGQLQQANASALQAYVTSVISSQGATVNVLDGISTLSIGGATFFVGYGANSQAMFANGTSATVATVPGNIECKPQPPQTGWWWNPAEGGRGFSIEYNGKKLFMAAYLYEDDGRASWLVASGPTSLDGSTFTGDLLRCAGGQTLTGAYPGFPNCTSPGKVALTFNSATRGTMVWPGGSVPIERFGMVPGGLTAAPQAGQPETGWWWNSAESGRGFFIEWQNGYADLAGYMYDASGRPLWYISVYPTPDARRFTGNWWQYGNGQTMTGTYRPAARVNDNVGSIVLEFSDATRATLTLPDGRRIPLTRFSF